MKKRPHDTLAENITFGVEIETVIPTAAGISIGYRHAGFRLPITGTNPAPAFHGIPWKAERDGSIHASQTGFTGCEFVSPVLSGSEGVRNLLAFLAWLKSIGAKVNITCGVHITIGVASVIGSGETAAVSGFARKLGHLCKWHARAIYGQTGTGRHLNGYSHPLPGCARAALRDLVSSRFEHERRQRALACGRGMLNLQKLIPGGLVEFRAFAGTLNPEKMLHHLSTALGLCRRAHQVRCLGDYNRNKLQSAATATAPEALEFLWRFLGWKGGSRECRLGLLEAAEPHAAAMMDAARRMCLRFEERYPAAVI